MLPGGWRFSCISWWLSPTSPKRKTRESAGSMRPRTTWSLNSAHSSTLAKCEPWKRFWRIQR